MIKRIWLVSVWLLCNTVVHAYNRYKIIGYPTSKIMICGVYFADTPTWIILREILTHPSTISFDTTFNGTGYLIDSSLGSGTAYGMAADSNGYIYVVGVTMVSGVPTWTVVRYTSTGTKDTTFNGTGIIQETALGTGQAYSVALSNNGVPPYSIYVSGYINISNRSIMTTISYNQDGTRNSTFHPTSPVGMVQDTSSPFDSYGPSLLYSCTVNQAGTVYTAGQYNNAWQVVSYLPNGQRNTIFGGTGVVSGSGISRARDIGVDTAGNILVVGNVAASRTSNSFMTITRYNPNGTVNQTLQETSKPNWNVLGLSFLPNNRFLIAGSGYQGSTLLPIVIYYDTNMTQVGAFNDTAHPNYISPALFAYIYSVSQVAFVDALSDADSHLIFPYSGTLQDIASPFNTTTNGFIYTTTIDQSGNIVVGGQYNNGALSIRYTTSAGRDGNFGNNGVATLTALATTATVQKIINSGTGYLAAGVSDTNKFTTFKLTNTGGFDNSFNSNGRIIESAVGVSAAYDILVTGTDLLSVAGVTGTNKPAIINYGFNGIRNSSLGNNGLQQFASYAPGTLYGLSLNTITNMRYGAGQSNSRALLAALYDQTGILQDTASPFNGTTDGFIYTTTIDQSGNIRAYLKTLKV